MKPRIKVLTLGVQDLVQAVRLGVPKKKDTFSLKRQEGCQDPRIVVSFRNKTPSLLVSARRASELRPRGTACTTGDQPYDGGAHVETSAIAASSCRTIHAIRWPKFEKGGQKDVKRVFVARHPTEAHLMKDLLEAEGIASEIQGEDLFGARGEAPLTPDTLPSVWVVNDADEDRAREFVSKYEKQEKATPSPVATWTCPACGETVEQQFSQCWNCNTPDPRSGS